MLKLAPQDIVNVQSIAALGEARGRAGRWPDQLFEFDPDWQQDGYLIDRVAAVVGVDSEVMLNLYRRAHARGLASLAATPAPN